MSVSENLKSISESLDDDVCLVAVSKRHPMDLIQEAYDTGHRDFGENMVQEMNDKYEALPKDIRWHLIGHLQRNKVKYIVGYVHLIHGVDSLKLLKEINKRASKVDRVVSCLLQVRIANEETKFGFDADELFVTLNNETFLQMTHVRILGLMGMATNTENNEVVSEEFKGLEDLFSRLKSEVSSPLVEMKYLSMGMSGDYKTALECGSNMLRIGSTIFGERPEK